MKKAKKAILIISISAISLSALYFLGGTIGGLIAFDIIFSRRFSSSETLNNDTYKFFKVRDDYPLLEKREEIVFQSNENALTGYFYQVDATMPTLITFHGLGSLSDGLDSQYQNYFVCKGYNVFSVDLSSSGKSEGNSLYGFNTWEEDIKKSVSFFASNYESYSKRLIGVGHSLGAYALCQSLATENSFSGIITFSCFEEGSSFMRDYSRRYIGWLSDFTYLPFSWSYSMKYGDSLSCSSILNSRNFPSLHFYGENDETVQLDHSLANALSKNQNNLAKVIYLNRIGHEMPWLDKEAYELGKSQFDEYKKALNEDKQAILNSIDKEKTSLISKEVDEALSSFLNLFRE